MDFSDVPIVLVTLMEEEEVFTNGTTNWVTRKVSPKEMAVAGPYLVGIRPRVLISG